MEFGRPIHTGRNVWIGGGAMILPGVTIGDDALIGAGSVVTRGVPAGATAFGNPARCELNHPVRCRTGGLLSVRFYPLEWAGRRKRRKSLS